MPNTSTTPAPSSRLGLSRERILEAALSLLDREGLDAFSMRRLAEELGTGTMTVYGYFGSREELLDAVIDAGARRLATLRPPGPWKASLRRLMLDLRQSHVDHPAIVELRLKRPLISPGALELTETAMGLLREAGFGDRDAARAYRTLFIYTFGFSAFGPGASAEAEREATLEALTALPPDRYPVLSRAADAAADAMGDPELFELGLDWLLDSLERRR